MIDASGWAAGTAVSKVVHRPKLELMAGALRQWLISEGNSVLGVNGMQMASGQP